MSDQGSILTGILFVFSIKTHYKTQDYGGKM